MRYLSLAALGICIAIVVSAGCITAVKNVMKKPATKVTEIPTITPIPTREEDLFEPVVYIEPVDLQLYRVGKKDLGEYYTWHRDNVSGQKDMTVSVTVYAYRFFSRYEWWSPQNGRYYWQFPAAGKKYLVVFAQIYMHGNDPSQDPRYYVGDEPWDRWKIQYNQTLIDADETYVKSIRIAELEETFTLNDDDRVKPWGYFWHNYGYSSNEDRRGVVAEPYTWLRMGRSNAIDGYIIFEVPDNALPEDLKVLSQWDTFGHPWWQLS